MTELAPSCETCVRDAVEATLRRHATGTARISVAIVDDAHMAGLNERHLHHKGPTDVLTFDLRDEPGAAPLADDAPDGVQSGADNPQIEAEIVLSVDTAAREARKRGHGVRAELALYAVHGVLHLLGYDDHGAADAARMHEVEDEILAAIGLGAVYKASRP